MQESAERHLTDFCRMTQIYNIYMNIYLHLHEHIYTSLWGSIRTEKMTCALGRDFHALCLGLFTNGMIFKFNNKIFNDVQF